MKYKVGDKVRIKSREWYEANKGADTDVGVIPVFVGEMSEYCGRIATILAVHGKDIPYYDIDIDSNEWAWSDEMFVDYLVEEVSRKEVDPRRCEIAKEMLAVFVTRPYSDGAKSLCVSMAVEWADALIAELDKGK